MPSLTDTAKPNMAKKAFSHLTYQLEIAGENAFILYLPQQQISPETAAKIQAASALLQPLLTPADGSAPVLQELIPSYASLLIVFNPLTHSHVSVKALLHATLAKPINALTSNQAKHIELPVWYSRQAQFDLARVAQAKQLSVDEVITLHSQCRYQVYAIGFAPGFAYLGELPAALAMPRLSTPRAKVPAGAVAIADQQTAVYPAVSPGGWHLLGLCPIAMFNAKQEPAMPLAVGDQVSFVPVTEREFTLLGGTL